MTTYAESVYRGVQLGEDQQYIHELCPMLYNYRLVLTPKANLEVWEFGWCYASEVAAVAAYRVWDPETEDEPLGWKKRPTSQVRAAPRRQEKPMYNRPRCIHGAYIGDGCADSCCWEQRGR